MKAIAYSVVAEENEPIAKANRKKHDITLLSNALTDRSINFANGKKAVIVSTKDFLSGKLVEQLAEMGVRYIATRSVESSHIDLNTTEKLGLKVGAVPAGYLDGAEQVDHYIIIANLIIGYLDSWNENSV